MLTEIPLFSVNLFEFKCEDQLTEKILEKVKQLEFQPNSSNYTSKTDLFYDKEMFSWLNTCVDEVRKNIGLDNKINLDITACWANKANRMQAHHLHSHSNSVLSGVFYLSSHDSAATVFKMPNYCLSHFSDWNFTVPVPERTAKIYPKKSTLIIFPSYIKHSVVTLNKNEERYTISFNTFFSGEINDGDRGTRLHIKTKKVEDWYET